ncbi:MAG: hypothetical protein Tsb0020_26240 [Haliangiales bacterium]
MPSPMFVCRTRDISERGCFLDTVELVPPGTRLQIALMDQERGTAMEVDGEVARCLPPGPDGKGRGLGVRFDNPPPEWYQLVGAHHTTQERERRARKLKHQRLRVLVVGDDKGQRGAMALYVTSGWDVRFASDRDAAEDALLGVRLDAVIIENNIAAAPWRKVLAAAVDIQPEARRVVRMVDSESGSEAAKPPGKGELAGTRGGGGDNDDDNVDPSERLCHAVIERDAGLDALLDALLPEPA